MRYLCIDITVNKNGLTWLYDDVVNKRHALGDENGKAHFFDVSDVFTNGRVFLSLIFFCIICVVSAKALVFGTSSREELYPFNGI